jgi:hypothetical protein
MIDECRLRFAIRSHLAKYGSGLMTRPEGARYSLPGLYKH